MPLYRVFNALLHYYLVSQTMSKLELATPVADSI